MAKRFTPSKRFIRNSVSGMVLSELIVAVLVAFLVLGIALQLAAYNRTLYLQDQNHNQVNQNLRAAMDIVGTDVKQAGEQIQLPLFPVISVQQDNTNTSGVTVSDLIIRRNLIGNPLPVCQNINLPANQNTTSILVNDTTSTIAGCSQNNNISNWVNYRTLHGGQVNAYIYNSISGNGEFLYPYRGLGNKQRISRG